MTQRREAHHVCVRGEDLATIAAAPLDDPVRREAEACARCRARLLAFAAFVEPLDPPDAAGIDEADAALAARLEATTGGRVRAGAGVIPMMPLAQERAPALAGRSPRTSADASPARWSARVIAIFGRPALRPAWALAVVLLMAWGAWESGWLQRPGGEGIELRGESGVPGDRFGTREASAEADGAVRVSWSAVPGADHYAVIVCDASLREAGRVEAGVETTARLDPALLRRLSAEGPLFWGVIASRGGDEIARSEIAPLPIARGR